MAKKETRKEELTEVRRNQILDAAGNVFAEKGLQKTRMDDIVHESGLSKGALYWYFKSKDDIILAILRRIFDGEFRMLSDLVEAQGTAEDRLRKFIDLVIRDLRSLTSFNAITYEFYALAFRSKSIRKIFRAYLEEYLRIMQSIIEQGIRDGEFRDYDSKDIAVAIGALSEGTLLLYAYDPDAIDMEQQLRSGIEILLSGLKKPN